MNARLKARLTKLETRLAIESVDFPSVAFGEYDRTDNEIVGVGRNGQNIERQSGEPVDEMIVRAQRQLRQKIVFIIYAGNSHSGDTCIVFPKDVHGTS